MNAAARILIEAFDYRGVSLRSSRWRGQVYAAREFYLGLSDDDILHGFRAAAGLPAPGRPLGGWCKENSSSVFGQWLSGMARLDELERLLAAEVARVGRAKASAKKV